ncbi:hypothetical protein APS56_04570 [Pseudalgibacter alginicilyticus]|uniref:Sucrase n=1 Tax=Pseudalgibacter alginicilyticus TaxID=1736674 RepID=A0A0P0CJD7_9FLAO|nr:glycoside hydrolase family protein [Pseudalgibacter alginicilyticus]ALJ04457.1 hypothetical protein APS56_04570 [Pseudalgibacter alginicilyticus]
MKFFLICFLIVVSSCKNNNDKKNNNDLTHDEYELNLGEMIQPTPKYSVMAHDDYYVWGASMIDTEDGLYHLFYSRWPKESEFKGWLNKSEIAYATASSPLGPFKYKKTILNGFGKGYWNEEAAHNPHVKYFNNKYYLYFISHHIKDYGLGARRNLTYGQRIGVAMADNPAGPWEVMDEPLIDYQKGKAAHGYMVNPSVCKMPDGSYLMMFKSRPEGSEKSKDFTAIQCLATSSSPAGPFIIKEEPTLTEATAEDPFIWYQQGKFYAIADDQYGDYLKVDRGLVLFESHDGFGWEVSKNPLVSYPEVTWEDGVVTKLKHLERPQLWFNKNGEPSVLLCAVMPTSEELSFNVQIPLKNLN